MTENPVPPIDQAITNAANSIRGAFKVLQVNIEQQLRNEGKSEPEIQDAVEHVRVKLGLRIDSLHTDLTFGPDSIAAYFRKL